MRYKYTKNYSVTKSPYRLVLVKSIFELLAQANHNNWALAIKKLKQLKRRSEESYKGLDWMPICRSDYEYLKSIYPTKLVTRPLPVKSTIKKESPKTCIVVFEDEDGRHEATFKDPKEADTWIRFMESTKSSGEKFEYITTYIK